MKQPRGDQKWENKWEANVEHDLKLLRQVSNGKIAIYLGFAVLTLALLGNLGVLLWS